MKKFLIASSVLFAPIALTAAPREVTVVAERTEVSEREIEQKIDAMLMLMKERLSLMSDVAKWKWNNAQPIEDLAQEKALLEDVCSDCEKSGLDKATVRAFFLAQFRAAKMIQINLFEEWVKKDVDNVDGAPDLKNGLKPKLTQLNQELLRHVKELAPYLKQKKYKSLLEARAKELLQGEKIDDQVRKAALESLSHS